MKYCIKDQHLTSGRKCLSYYVISLYGFLKLKVYSFLQSHVFIHINTLVIFVIYYVLILYIILAHNCALGEVVGRWPLERLDSVDVGRSFQTAGHNE